MKNHGTYSRIIAGTMTWGSWGKQLSKVAMMELMHHCLELGISTFDHADIYGGYTTEADFGNAFKDSKISREKIQIISKCGIQMVSENRNTKIKHYDYSKDQIVGSVERSLKNLMTEYLDLLLLHRPSPLMNPEEISEAIHSLKEAGKIRAVGVSNFTPPQIKMLEDFISVSVNQVEFSLTHNKIFYDGTMDDCIAHKRTCMAWSPLGSFFKADDKKVTRIKKVMQALQEKYSATPDQLLLAWLLKHPAKIAPVVGTTSKERLQKSVEATNIDLGLEDWFLLLEASTGHEVA